MPPCCATEQQNCGKMKMIEFIIRVCGVYVWATGLCDYHRPYIDKPGKLYSKNMHKITELITKRILWLPTAVPQAVAVVATKCLLHRRKVVTRLQCEIYVGCECKSFRYATLTTAAKSESDSKSESESESLSE